MNIYPEHDQTNLPLGNRVKIGLTEGMNPSRRDIMKKVTLFQIVMVLFLCINLAGPSGLMAQGAQQGTAQEGAAPFRPEEIDQLAAPIALYPDSLLAQVLAASTYPLEIVQAARFVRQNKELKGEKLMAAAKDKDWDPSVKAMLEFPDVLLMMDEKLEWTEKLGDAVLSQQKDVMAAVQRLRQKAQESGNLKTTQEQKVVVEKETKTIIIEPANPQVVYVPTYNPTVVYGVWAYPAYPPYPVYPYGYAATAAFSFAAGVAVGAAWGGYGGWGCGWGNNEVDINVNKQNSFTQNNYNNSQKYQKKETGQSGQSGQKQNWQHNPEHRGNAQYKDQRTAQKYGQQRQGSGARASTSDARGYGSGGGQRGGQGPQTSDLSRGGQGAGDRGGGKPQTSDLSRGGQGAGDRSGGRPQTGDMSRGTGDKGGAKPQTSDASRGGGKESALSGSGNGGSERAASNRGQESRSSASRSSGSSGGSKSSGASRSTGGGSRGGGGGSRSGGRR
jgi:hypothetical protein